MSFKKDIESLQRALGTVGEFAKLEITHDTVSLREDSPRGYSLHAAGSDSVADVLEESVDRFFEEPRPRIY